VTVGATTEFIPATLSLVPASWRSVPSGAARTVEVQSWAATKRTTKVGAGAASLLVVAENYNVGWQASLGSRPLRPIRVDGWVQAFVVPAGAGGQVELTFGPDQPYRAGLLLLPLGLLLLLVGASLSGRAHDGRVPAVPSRRLTWVGSGVAVVLLGGWWGVATFVVAGLVVAGCTRLYEGHRPPYPVLVALPMATAGTLVVLRPWAYGGDPALLGLGAQVSCLLALSLLGWVVSAPGGRVPKSRQGAAESEAAQPGAR
jgi:arabinofuranan 3-O-arabinosyltransferase